MSTEALAARWGILLTDAIKASPLTVRTLSREIDKSTSAIYEWLKGAGMPSTANQLAICRALGIADGRDIFPLVVDPEAVRSDAIDVACGVIAEALNDKQGMAEAADEAFKPGDDDITDAQRAKLVRDLGIGA
jgi:transcriptional regulator with XRE-family HTH domain